MTTQSSRKRPILASALVTFGLSALLIVAAVSNGSVDAAASNASQITAHVGVIKGVSVPAHKAGPDSSLTTPNPFLSFLAEGSTPDYDIWRKKMHAEAVSRREQKKVLAASQGISPLALIPVGETEPSGTKGVNDTVATAENIPNFGTGDGDDAEADISGELKAPSVPTEFFPNAEDEGDINESSATGLMGEDARFASATIGDGPFGSDPVTVTNLTEFAEDNGDINKAGDTMVMLGEQVNVDAEIGNGPHGSSGTGMGDFDFYAVTISDGQLIQATVTRQVGETVFDSILGIYDPAGNLIAFNDDINADLESGINITINTGGPDVTVYFAVGSWFGNLTLPEDFLTDPFDSSTGPGVETEGRYTFSVTLPDPQPGDFDFYHVVAAEGDLITIEVDTENYGGILDPIVAVYDSAGNFLLFNDDDPDPNELSFDSFLQFNAPFADIFYISVGGFNPSIFITPLSFLMDPFDSSSGPGFGSEGDYDIIVSLDDIDLDFYSFELEAGDILGVNVMGGDASVGIFAADETLLIASSGDTSGAYPFPSPLPAGGTASAAYIVNASGTYAAAVGFGDGAYTYELRVFRPPQEATGNKQIIYLDFDGETVDPSKWGGPPGPVALSPLSSFLGNWGLSGADENAVIDAILAEFEQNISTDIRANGANPAFDIEIQNSRDDAPTFGDPYVSRIIIGGTIAESGISTIGIAQSIDIGNFDQEEDSFVLLDLLSEVPPDPNSMNSYPRDPGATIIDLIGVGVGNIAAHEAGHFFANWHTDNFSVDANLMDAGGNMAGTIGIGFDGIFGTGDDVDVNFGVDLYDPSEFFSGMEDTRNNIAFGLTTGTEVPARDLTSFSDVSGDGIADFASFIDDGLGGGPKIDVLSGANGSDVSTISFFNVAWTGRAIEAAADGNSDGVANDPAIAVLGFNPATSATIVQVRMAMTGAFVRNIQFFNPAWTKPLDIIVIDDVDGDGNTDDAAIGVLALNEATNAIAVQVKRLSNGSTIATRYFLNPAWSPRAAAAIVRPGQTPLIGVMAVNPVTGSTVVQSRQLSDGAVQANTYYFNIAWRGQDVAVETDLNSDGTADDPAWMVMATNDSSNNSAVQVRSVNTGTVVKNIFFLNPAWESNRVTGSGDISGNLISEVAGMARNRTNDNIVIQVRDYGTTAVTRNIFP